MCFFWPWLGPELRAPQRSSTLWKYECWRRDEPGLQRARSRLGTAVKKGCSGRDCSGCWGRLGTGWDGACALSGGLALVTRSPSLSLVHLRANHNAYPVEGRPEGRGGVSHTGTHGTGTCLEAICFYHPVLVQELSSSWSCSGSPGVILCFCPNYFHRRPCVVLLPQPPFPQACRIPEKEGFCL